MHRKCVSVDEIPNVTGGQERLLPGEHVDTPLADDARHFMSVYEELLSFQELALSQAAGGSDLDQGAASPHLAQLATERDRLRRRLEFWTRRYHELAGQ